MEKNYDDIINLPHPVSKTHPPMSMQQRAAQFSAFQALTGYKECLDKETKIVENQYNKSEKDNDDY